MLANFRHSIGGVGEAEGEQSLVGTRLPSGTGVAGWVLTSRQPLVIDDTSKDSRHSVETAKRTGFLPQNLMCAPLLDGDRALGVIQFDQLPDAAHFAHR